MDYYAVLDLDVNCTDEEVKAQYRRLALLHHPDVNPGDEEGSTARLRTINEAYEILSDPVKRRVYDLTVDKPLPQSARQPSGSSDTPHPTAADPITPRANPYTGAIGDARRRAERRTAAAAVFAGGFLIFLLSRSPFGFGHWNIPDQINDPEPTGIYDTQSKEQLVGTLQSAMNRIQPQINSIVAEGQNVAKLSDPARDDSNRQAAFNRLSGEITALQDADNISQDDIREAQTLELRPLRQSMEKYRTDFEDMRTAGQNAYRDIIELSRPVEQPH